MTSKFTLPPEEFPALRPEEDTHLNAIADEDIADEVGVSLEEVIAWVESWGSPNELPTPKVSRPKLRDAINATLDAGRRSRARRIYQRGRGRSPSG